MVISNFEYQLTYIICDSSIQSGSLYKPLFILPIGASAQLAGTIRLTYSLTAIILEATGNLTYIFPIFVTVLIAKIVGDFINEGEYLMYYFLNFLLKIFIAFCEIRLSYTKLLSRKTTMY